MWRRALRLVRPDPARDVDDEFAFHLAMREAEYQRLGASPEQARQMTRERFGDVAGARDACVTVDHRRLRAARRLLVLEELGQDVRFAVRTLRRRPGFAAAVIVTLALGIGATTGIFAVTHAILLQPPARVHAPHELVAVYTSDFSGPPRPAWSPGWRSRWVSRDWRPACCSAWPRPTPRRSARRSSCCCSWSRRPAGCRHGKSRRSIPPT